MMYIAAYPIAMSIRATNVYEERSLVRTFLPRHLYIQSVNILIGLVRRRNSAAGGQRSGRRRESGETGPRKQGRNIVQQIPWHARAEAAVL